jgi:hypothetical protein
MVRVVRALTEKEASGDVAAMKLFFQYLLGKPAETVDPDRIGLDEWQKLKEAAIDSQEAADVLEKVPATMACDHTRTYWPVVLERNMREALEEHAEAEAAAAEDERYLASRSADEMWMEEGGSGWGRLLSPAVAGVREEAISAILNRDRPSPNGDGTATGAHE